MAMETIYIGILEIQWAKWVMMRQS